MTAIMRDPPRFTSARGTVEEWIDREQSYRAFAHFTKARYEVQLVDIAERRAAHPDWREQELQGHPPPSPEMPGVWEPESGSHRVRVLPPERSLTFSFRPHDGSMVPSGVTDVTPERTTMHFAVRVGESLTQVVSRPTTLWRRDDLDAYCYGPHTREALALLQPRCFFYGREPIWAEPAAMTFLGRPAKLMRLRRMIPLDDPRILGDQFNPIVFEETMETEVIVDLERGVVLEWRGLFNGAPYERHVFTEIAFDESMDSDDFDREAEPR